MMFKQLKVDWSIILLIIFWTVCASLYPILPEQIPSHWNLSGNIDGYVNKAIGSLLLPLLPIGMYLLMTLLPMIDPKNANYALFKTTYELIKRTLSSMLALFIAIPLLVAFGYNIDVQFIIRGGAVVIYIILGNYMGKIRPNYFMGIRTPWTLSNDLVWHKTHRLAGKLMVTGGILALSSLLLPSIIGIALYFFSIFLPLLLSALYSYILYNKLK